MTAWYGSLHDEAAALDAVLAEKFPDMSPEVRGQFPSAVLFKVADMYRRGACRVELAECDADGAFTGARRALLGWSGPDGRERFLDGEGRVV